jgi:hypothetical protein
MPPGPTCPAARPGSRGRWHGGRRARVRGRQPVQGRADDGEGDGGGRRRIAEGPASAPGDGWRPPRPASQEVRHADDQALGVHPRCWRRARRLPAAAAGSRRMAARDVVIEDPTDHRCLGLEDLEPCRAVRGPREPAISISDLDVHRLTESSPEGAAAPGAFGPAPVPTRPSHMEDQCRHRHHPQHRGRPLVVVPLQGDDAQAVCALPGDLTEHGGHRPARRAPGGDRRRGLPRPAGADEPGPGRAKLAGWRRSSSPPTPW